MSKLLYKTTILCNNSIYFERNIQLYKIHTMSEKRLKKKFIKIMIQNTYKKS